MKPAEIKELRKRLNLTQEQLGDLIGAQRKTIVRWETGRHEPLGNNLKLLKNLIVKSKE